MNTAVRKSGDWFLLKSAVCVAAVACAALLLLRHAAPAEKEKKFFGGGVWLLPAQTPEEAGRFFRWMQLNQPSNIFGYNSAGIFSQAVVRKPESFLPVTRDAGAFALLSRLPVSGYNGGAKMLLGTESTAHPGSISSVGTAAAVSTVPFQTSGLPVFNEAGGILFALQGIAPTDKSNVLLIKADEDMTGTAFSVIESSGDRKFDSNVIKALEQRQGGEPLRGILAVWPESGRGK